MVNFTLNMFFFWIYVTLFRTSVAAWWTLSGFDIIILYCHVTDLLPNNTISFQVKLVEASALKVTRLSNLTTYTLIYTPKMEENPMLRTCGSSMEAVTQMMLMVWFLNLHTHMFFSFPFRLMGRVVEPAACRGRQDNLWTSVQLITAPVETVQESMCCSFVEWPHLFPHGRMAWGK